MNTFSRFVAGPYLNEKQAPSTASTNLPITASPATCCAVFFEGWAGGRCRWEGPGPSSPSSSISSSSLAMLGPLKKWKGEYGHE